ncbi:unnamed protein product [marine sediment metagenome]|uniref:Uncharacterized protein n=1 Tax=marine sediment metagenome TaxID=412755 RepID=X1HLV2_9ZZZZ
MCSFDEVMNWYNGEKWKKKNTVLRTSLKASTGSSRSEGTVGAGRRGCAGTRTARNGLQSNTRVNSTAKISAGIGISEEWKPFDKEGEKCLSLE